MEMPITTALCSRSMPAALVGSLFISGSSSLWLSSLLACSFCSSLLGWVGRFAAVSVVVALALYGVLQAVDGVALKHAVDAWASAPEAEKATRFASAETMRWLEWGTSNYQTFMFALALILLATVIVWTARVPRAIGYLMGLAAIPPLVQSLVLGTEGFSVPLLAGSLSAVGLPLMLAWSIWLLIVAWRMKEPTQAG